MSIDYDLFDDFKKSLADRYTAEELCELLSLDVWDVIEQFQERILDMHLEK